MSAAVGGVGVERFVKANDEKPVAPGRERRVVRQGSDNVGLQPGVGLLRSSIVSIVVDVGDDKRKFGQRVAGQVRSELGKRPDDGIRHLSVAGHVGEQGEGIVANEVKTGVSADIALRDAFRVDLE